MKNKLILLLGFSFNKLNKIIPKMAGKCVISAFPDFEDMTRGLLPLLTDKRVIILTRREYSHYPKWLDSKVIVRKKYSFKGFFHILTAETIYFTHGIFSFFKKLEISKQKVINAWHGMPLKNIGILDGKDTFPDSHEIYSTSPFFQNIMAQASGKKAEEIILSGLPRNNILLEPVVNKELIKLKNKFDKVIVWLPTYRKTTIGDIRDDGDNLPVYGFPNFDAEKFNKTLKNNNVLVIIKPHPLDVKDKAKVEHSNIKHIDEEWLFLNDLTLYELLGASDMLWTDFSSVFVDYLIIKNPILFVVPDLEEYKRNRGFTFDLNEFSLFDNLIDNAELLYEFIESGCALSASNACYEFNTVPKFKFA